MKKLLILCLVLTVVLMSGCSKKKDTDGTDSTIDIKPGLSDSIFDENGNVSGTPGASVPKPDAPIDTDKESYFNPENPKDCTYEQFVAMTPAQQEACMKAYGSMEAFFEWYNKAKKEYEDTHPPIDVGDGNIDLDSILNGK